MIEKIYAKNQNYRVVKPYRCKICKTIQWLSKRTPPGCPWLVKVPVICNACHGVQAFVEI